MPATFPLPSAEYTTLVFMTIIHFGNLFHIVTDRIAHVLAERYAAGTSGSQQSVSVGPIVTFDTSVVR